MQLKIVSINLWLGGKLMDSIVDFLIHEKPNILLVQEAFNGEDRDLDARFRSMQVLSSSLGFGYTDFAPCYRDFDHTNGLAQRGNGILSKLPIVSSSVSYFSIPYNETHRDIPEMYADCPNNLQHVVAEAGETQLNIFNTHGPYGINGDEYNDHRKSMSEVVVREITGRSKVFFAGDTNATPDNQMIQNFRAQLNDVFGDTIETTFNISRKDNPAYGGLVVDYAFTSADIKILSKSCPGADISDHLPLIVNIEA